jgi:hypothetical protein
VGTPVSVKFFFSAKKTQELARLVGYNRGVGTKAKSVARFVANPKDMASDRHGFFADILMNPDGLYPG